MYQDVRPLFPPGFRPAGVDTNALGPARGGEEGSPWAQSDPWAGPTAFIWPTEPDEFVTLHYSVE